MTKIDFKLADVFKHVNYVNWTIGLAREYSNRFPGWERIVIDIWELTALENQSTDSIRITEKGCMVKIKIWPGDQQYFYNRIKIILQKLATEHFSHLQQNNL